MAPGGGTGAATTTGVDSSGLRMPRGPTLFWRVAVRGRASTERASSASAPATASGPGVRVTTGLAGTEGPGVPSEDRAEGREAMDGGGAGMTTGVRPPRPPRRGGATTGGAAGTTGTLPGWVTTTGPPPLGALAPRRPPCAPSTARLTALGASGVRAGAAAGGTVTTARPRLEGAPPLPRPRPRLPPRADMKELARSDSRGWMRLLLLAASLCALGVCFDDDSIAMCGGFVKPWSKALAKAGCVTRRKTLYSPCRP